MRDMDWNKLLKKELPAHFIPEPKPPVKPRRYDTEQLEKIEKEKEEAKVKFQERVIVKEEEFKRRPEHKEEKLDMIFNNED